ncbi:GMC family oxidoreductase [Acinetobacter pittii]|uniref:GMC family oxidoreductase n=1 Tax=Acinetobacter pittii TaxID=48296 RepID=UPI001EE55C92|nr:GMC family oxidoreductase [Acinetobacter pittii]MCG5226900.1 GMC family oxidoreductase [Acinetobacter pittii]
MASNSYDYDYLIIGSGFGGSVSACRLTEKGYSVAVMEMGRRWKAEDFAKNNWNTRRWIWRPGMKLFGYFNMRFFRHVTIICGNAVGGGSITYANTLLVPPEHIWDEGTWADAADWKNEMPQHYAEAERMLGVTDNKILGPADHMLKKMGEAVGVGHTFKPTRVATFFPPEGEEGGKTYPDPYFNGEGPDRGTCTACGGCMTGCKHNAKNTLDKNYLYFAEKNGAKVYEETKVVDVKPLNGKADGSDGYEVTTECSSSWFNKQRRTWRVRNVIFSASSLGTQEMLFRLKQSGSLPNISDDLGNRVRTNAESILGVRFFDKDVDMSKGVAIGSSIYIDHDTHIEATRYQGGSDAMGLMCTYMAKGKPGWTRIFYWLWILISHPLIFLRMSNPVGFARQTLIFLVMQTADASINMRLKRNWFWPFGKVLSSEGKKLPVYIPQANTFTEKIAKMFNGHPITTITEILFNVPFTAHCMGGCAIASSPEQGVVDGKNRVFNYKNLYVVDGSMLGANLGVNPSLTITALAERAMSYIPAKHTLDEQQDHRVEADTIEITKASA